MERGRRLTSGRTSSYYRYLDNSIGIAMNHVGNAQNLKKSRTSIARKVQDLRRARHWTQAELARLLHLSQSRLSEIEGGDGSFTAEQFLTILRLFNVAASEFVHEHADPTAELQNALARLGAL